MKSLFEIFGPKKSATKDDGYVEAPTNLKGFFIVLGRKFWNISNLNLLYVLCNIPIFFFLYTLTGQLNNHVQVVGNPLYPAYFGMLTISKDPSLLGLNGLVSKFVELSVPTTATYVFWGLSALCILTFGLSNSGMAYIIRGYNRGEPIFITSDFFGSVKRNWKQGLILGIIDLLFCYLLVWDFIFWNAQGGFINGVFYYVSMFLCILYFFMRFYMYTIMITFKLSIFKILKNSFLFAFLGAKRNIMALIGIAVVLVANVYLFYALPVFGVLLPLIITISLCCFISGYASYPVIKKFMIDPYYKEEHVSDEDGNVETIFTDRG